jgi:hypothetical protein
MIGLSDSQLEIITREAATLSEEICQEFLEKVAEAVAVVLEMHGQINDGDVALAVQLALRSLTNNSAALQNWNRNQLPTATRRGRLPPWSVKFRNWATLVFADALAWGKKYYFE